MLTKLKTEPMRGRTAFAVLTIALAHALAVPRADAQRQQTALRRSRAGLASDASQGVVDSSNGIALRLEKAKRGALWGLGTYLVVATAYIIHENSTCNGPDCFGEGFAWIGLAGGVPISAGIGAAVGFVLPVHARPQSDAPRYPSPSPADALGSGLSRGVASADSIIAAAVEHTIPGAVLLVAQNGKVLHERTFGWAELNDFQGHRLPNPRPMRTSTMFDLASVTKVMATTMSVMRLASQGRIDVDAPVYRYLPDFRDPHLDSITVRHLLTHSAGLVQWQPLYYHASNERETYDVIRRMPLQWGVGEGRHYSDLGFMLLGLIVEHVTGMRLDRYVADSLYRPLGLRSTTYLPKQHGFTDFAVTEQGNGYERHMVYDSTFGYRYRGDPTKWNGWREYVLNGETDDGNAWYANGGVAGHAGLFATAADLHVLLDLLLAHGSLGGTQYIRPEVVDSFLTRDRYQNFLGWMSPNGLPRGSFSHTGFTGTYVLGVPEQSLSIVLLTNRQNMGTDARGYFPDVGPLQAAVSRAIIAGAESDARQR